MVLRDAEIAPDVLVLDPREFLEPIAAVLLEAFPLSVRRRRRVRAALDHALDFRTRDSFVHRLGLTDEATVDLMTELVTAAARPGTRRTTGRT